MSRSSSPIACVSWLDATVGVWDPLTLGPKLSGLCSAQPFAPSATTIDSFVQAGFEASSLSLGRSGGRAGKACLLLETRCPHSGTRPMGAALWSYAAHEAELEYVVVDATWRRQGWGCVLMELSHAHLAHGAMDVRRFVLEVATKNLHAIVLYRALGYRQEGVRLRYYKDGQDALVMVRENRGHS